MHSFLQDCKGGEKQQMFSASFNLIRGLLSFAVRDDIVAGPSGMTDIVSCPDFIRVKT